MRLIITSLLLFLCGCSTHKINAVRILDQSGTPISGAHVAFGSTMSGQLPGYLAQAGPSDELGIAKLSDSFYVNSYSNVKIIKDDGSVFMIYREFQFERPKTLILKIPADEKFRTETEIAEDAKLFWQSIRAKENGN